MKIKFALMVGGEGLRLWPLSNKSTPKQFLKIFGKNTLVEDSILRNTGMGSQILLSNVDHLDAIKEISDKYDIEVALEPFRKGTAVLGLISSILAIEQGYDVVVLSPCDLMIKNQDMYAENIKRAVQFAVSKDKIVLFGIAPTEPESGYGYIKTGVEIEKNIFHVEKFVEKPNTNTAKEYLDSDQYLWNSGIFVFKPSVILEEFEKFDKRTKDLCIQSIRNSKKNGKFLELDGDFYRKIHKGSIDRSIIEKSDNIAVLKANFSWSDLGSFKSLLKELRNDDGNFLLGDTYIKNVKNCYINSKNKIVVANNIENIAVVVKGDYVLISNLKDSNTLKELVSNINESKLSR